MAFLVFDLLKSSKLKFSLDFIMVPTRLQVCAQSYAHIAAFIFGTCKPANSHGTSTNSYAGVGKSPLIHAGHNFISPAVTRSY